VKLRSSATLLVLAAAAGLIGEPQRTVYDGRGDDLLTAGLGAAGLRAAPPELVGNLERLVPAKHYHLELSGVLRGSASGKMTVEDAFRAMHIALEPASFSTQDGTLTLANCRFEYQKRAFSTSATLRKNEYTVLGAAGEQPVFLVLRLAVE